MKAQETKKVKELIKFLKRPLDGKIAKVLTWEENKILLDYIEDLESKNKEKIILNKLEEWLEKESNKTFLNVIPMAVYMKIQDKIKKLKEEYK